MAAALNRHSSLTALRLASNGLEADHLKTIARHNTKLVTLLVQACQSAQGLPSPSVAVHRRPSPSIAVP